MSLFKSKNMDSDPGEKASLKELLFTFITEHKIVCFIVSFLVIAAIVLTVQSFKKTEYEMYLMYCGPVYASSVDIYGNVMEEAANACADGDDKPVVAFSTIVYVPDELAEYYQKEGIEYNGAYNAEALQNFDYALAAGEYCILMLDRSLYDKTKSLDVFVPLSDLGISSDSSVDDYALKLSELSIGKRPGFSSLPEDTVIVFREKSFIQSLFANKKKTNARYETQRTFFVSLVNSR